MRWRYPDLAPISYHLRITVGASVCRKVLETKNLGFRLILAQVHISFQATIPVEIEVTKEREQFSTNHLETYVERPTNWIRSGQELTRRIFLRSTSTEAPFQRASEPNNITVSISDQVPTIRQRLISGKVGIVLQGSLEHILVIRNQVQDSTTTRSSWTNATGDTESPFLKLRSEK